MLKSILRRAMQRHCRLTEGAWSHVLLYADLGTLARFFVTCRSGGGGVVFALTGRAIPDGRLPLRKLLLRHGAGDSLEGDTWHWPARPSIYRNSFTLGLVKSYFGGLVLSKMTRRAVNLKSFLVKLIESERPEHKYSSIHLTRSVASGSFAGKMHVDSDNEGPTLITGFGNFTGGELWIYDPSAPDDQAVFMSVTEPLEGYPWTEGQQVRGRAQCIRDRWVEYDGRKPHAMMPFVGTRYSINYFNKPGWAAAAPADLAILHDCQFQSPAGEEHDGYPLARGRGEVPWMTLRDRHPEPEGEDGLASKVHQLQRMGFGHIDGLGTILLAHGTDVWSAIGSLVDCNDRVV